MPNDPIDFRIIQSLQTALRSISIAGGYHHDVQAVAVKLDPNHDVETLIAPDGPRPFVIVEVRPENIQYFPASQVRMVLNVTIHWVSDAVPTDDDSRMRTYLRGCADVEQAIAKDEATRTHGGLAVDTTIVKRTFDTAVDGAQVWALIDTEIILHRTFGAPNG